MKILVVGAGGREHALCTGPAQAPRWSASAAPRERRDRRGRGVRRPTSSRTARRARRLRDLARRSTSWWSAPRPRWWRASPTRCARRGSRASARAPTGARLEGSKAWAKALMVRNNIPTAGYHVFTIARGGARVLPRGSSRIPLVVKADGLAAGKGVTVCFAATRPTGPSRTPWSSASSATPAGRWSSRSSCAARRSRSMR